MAKCLRCGAGGEWLQGNPPKDQTDYKDRCERLEQSLRDIILACHDLTITSGECVQAAGRIAQDALKDQANG